MNFSIAMWNAKIPAFARAAARLPDDRFLIRSLNELDDEKCRSEFFAWTEANADVLLVYRTKGDVWTELEAPVRSLSGKVKTLSVGRDPEDWALSNQPPALLARLQEYVAYDGDENTFSMLRLIMKELGGRDIEVPPPVKIPWDGIWFPGAGMTFRDLGGFLGWAVPSGNFEDGAATVGIYFYRSCWASGNTAHVEALICELRRRGCNAVPVFSMGSFAGIRDGARHPREIFSSCFMKDGRSAVDAVLDLESFFLGDREHPGVEICRILGVPVLNGIVSYRQSRRQWLANPQGIARSLPMTVCGPEFDGVAEPLVVAAVRKDSLNGVEFEQYEAIPDRVSRAVDRLLGWARLGRKPPPQRKIAFILHSNPCASAEATVGGGAKLDTLESVARILRAMKRAGYRVKAPKNGKALINKIVERKALSEFRWTSSAEIVRKGGALDLLEKERYSRWFDKLDESVRRKVADAWGNPPGEEKDGIPAAMIHEGRIIVSGISLGNAVVCVQPKRGCAGARCDGRVCKILHDPTVPPTHQYIATYRWIEEEFKADCIVHVGTHGNLEFLPGKSVGLSGSCFPDICLGGVPHLYIYNADNPPEGVVAKRRSLAVLVDHMQTPMDGAGTYNELAEIERLLEEHQKASLQDRARAHFIEHKVVELARKCGLMDEFRELRRNEDGHFEFDELSGLLHGKIFQLKNSRIPKGMHVFGKIPDGRKRAEMIYSIMRHSTEGGKSFRHDLAAALGHDFEALLTGSKDSPEKHAAVDEIDKTGRKIVSMILAEKTPRTRRDKACLAAVGAHVPKIRDIGRRIAESKEIEALLEGFDARYIPSGPAGLITRGRDDVLPTGRNFYSLDPRSVPSRSAFEIGKRLNTALLAKFAEGGGRMPENIAFYWMANDIMWSDGEVMSQILDLIGCEPEWDSAGRVSGFNIVAAENLPRPRIDVTVRVSGITRDNFPSCVELVDEAIQAVAGLDEPPEINMIRKHALDFVGGDAARLREEEAFRQATFRIFAAQPGSYQAGVQLAVYASAWKDQKDLADIFLYWNGYAYGKGHYGVKAHDKLRQNLKTVDMTYNKTASDESDLFGCCCYFGTQGGMTAAARSITGREVPGYYGDTREPVSVDVRTLEQEIQRVARTKLLNPKWIEGMKRHGYKGAGDISKGIGRVYGWEASANAVADWIFDGITDTFVLDGQMKAWFQENNKWALEEISRRLVEAHERGLWQTDEERWESLKEACLEIEGWMEEDCGEFASEVQGSGIDIISTADVAAWKSRMEEALK